MAHLITFAQLHSLYQLSLNNSFKANSDIDLLYSTTSAFMAMNNIMPYHVPACIEQLKGFSNMNAANVMAETVIAMVEKPTGIKIPSPDDLLEELMTLTWTGLFSNLQYWPDWLRNPFHNPYPLTVMRENERIENTGSFISARYGESQFSVWRDTLTFPVHSLMVGKDFMLNTCKYSKLASVCRDEKYTANDEFLKFLDTMSFLMKETTQYVWLPIYWPSLIKDYTETTYPDDYFEQTIEGASTFTPQRLMQHFQALGIYNPLVELHNSCRKLHDEIKVYANKDVTDLQDIKNVIRYFFGLEIKKKRAIDDDTRFEIVNNTLKLATSLVQGYIRNQQS